MSGPSHVLFYSNNCSHCKNLISELNNRKVDNVVKQVCIETLQMMRQPIPSTIHSVPALMRLSDKSVFFGKQVFDYLFLPSTGLLSGRITTPNQLQAIGNPQVNGNVNTGEPLPSSSLGSRYSDPFSFIDEKAVGVGASMEDTTAYYWTDLSRDMGPAVYTPSGRNQQQAQALGRAQSQFQGSVETPIQETRTKKLLPNIDDIKNRRDADMVVGNRPAMLPPAAMQNR